MSRIRSTLDDYEHQRKPKVILRDSWRKQIKKRGTRLIWKANGILKRKKGLKKIARSRRTEMERYFELSTEFLLRPENKFCIICIVRREHGENILINIATEIHHFFGRIGRLLCYVPGFRPSCNRCRTWPHDHAATARECGLLAPPALWNVFPGDGNGAGD